MRALRVLIWLLAALALAASPVTVSANVSVSQDSSGCADHHAPKSKAGSVQTCCVSSLVALPATMAVSPVATSFFRPAARTLKLHSTILQRDPPPPRV